MAEKITGTPLKSPHLLWELYQNIVFRWLNKPLPGKNLIIITAFNPRSQDCPEQLNLQRQQSLFGQLKSITSSVVEVEVGDQKLRYSELSLAADIPVREAILLAKEYQQNAIYVVENGELLLVPVLIKDKQTTSLGRFCDLVITGE